MKTGMRAAVAMLLSLAAVSFLGAPASAQAGASSCGGVFQGEGDDAGTLQKSITSIVALDADTFRIAYTVTGTASAYPGDVRIRECVFFDANKNGVFDTGDTIVHEGDEKQTTFDGLEDFTVDVDIPAGATFDNNLCDAVAISGTRDDGNPLTLDDSFTDKTDIECEVGPPPPVIPEVPMAVALPIVGAALFGVSFWLMRRREQTATAA